MIGTYVQDDSCVEDRREEESLVLQCGGNGSTGILLAFASLCFRGGGTLCLRLLHREWVEIECRHISQHVIDGLNGATRRGGEAATCFENDPIEIRQQFDGQ